MAGQTLGEDAHRRIQARVHTHIHAHMMPGWEGLGAVGKTLCSGHMSMSWIGPEHDHRKQVPCFLLFPSVEEK